MHCWQLRGTQTYGLPLEEAGHVGSWSVGMEGEGGEAVMVYDPMLVAAYLSGWWEGGGWRKKTITGQNDGTERTGQGYWGTQTHTC